MKKFFKTYYSQPHKSDRVDLIFERGYKNIEVRYNGQHVKSFAAAPALFQTQEITTADDSVIHLRFLKDSVDFEVFLNGQQIDNSETSPSKIATSLRWPVYISMSWYILVLVIGIVTEPAIVSYIFHNPSVLLEPLVIYFFTSTLIVLALLITTLFTLKKGSLMMYYTALIAISADLLFGLVFHLIGLSEGSGFLGFIFGMLLPVVFKSAVIWSFLTNIKKYHQYALQRSREKPKKDSEIVDVA